MKILSAQDTDSTPKVATVGVFDGVHSGHRYLLSKVVTWATDTDSEPTVVTFSTHPQEVVSGIRVKMLSTLDERISHFEEAGIECVVVLDFNEALQNLSAREFMTMLHARYNVERLLVGFNNRFGKDRLQGFEEYREIGEEVGIEVRRFVQLSDSTEGEDGKISSSIIRGLLEEGKVEDAGKKLTRYYSLTGKVVHGKEFGRTIGFPTANIECTNPGALVPGNGVYAVSVELPDGSTHPGMLNIGHRPTVDSADAPRSLEVHIMDYSGDLYGKTVTVRFIKFLRHEQPFPTVEALRAQLQKDAAEVRALQG